MSVLEQVVFKILGNVGEEDFLAQSVNIGEWASQQPGFQYRALAKQENGEWMDLVFWADMASAKAAVEAFPKSEQVAAALAMIDGSSVRISHSDIFQQQGV